MAQAANRSNVAADMRPPDYRNAVKRIETIQAKSERQQRIAKEIGDVYSACESICGVHKTSAKMFRALSKAEPEEQLKIFRDLNGLLDAAGIAKTGSDLVDSAQDNLVHFRLPGDDGGIDEEADIDSDLNPEEQPVEKDDDDFEMPEEELAQQKSRKEVAEAKAVKGSGRKARGAKADPEPYTGDNSDLAGE